PVFANQNFTQEWRLKTRKSFLGTKGPGSPALFWSVFCVLILSQFLLSFGPFSLGTKFVILSAGVLFPLILWARRRTEPGISGGSLDQQKLSFSIPVWAWVVLLGAALFVRFLNIDTAFLWPTGDEGLKGAAAIGLSQKW